MQGFARFVNENNLLDLELKRVKFTWTNGRHGASHIEEKLDRIVVSKDRITNFGDYTILGYPKNGSDYNLLLLETQEQRR